MAAFGVGTAIEQEFNQLRIPCMRRENRCAHAPGIHVVHVRARGDEQLRRAEIADPRGKHQRGVIPVRDRAVVLEQAVRRRRHHLTPCLRTRVHVGPVREQHLHNIGMFLGDGPHQRGLAARGAGVHIGALCQQLFDDLRIARP